MQDELSSFVNGLKKFNPREADDKFSACNMIKTCAEIARLAPPDVFDFHHLPSSLDLRGASRPLGIQKTRDVWLHPHDYLWPPGPVSEKAQCTRCNSGAVKVA